MLSNNLYSRHNKAIADTGFSGHCLHPFTSYENKINTNNGPTVTLPDGNIISPSHEANLPILNTSFSTKTLQAYIFQQQIKKPLVSIGKFCDDGKIALFTQNKCIILNDVTKLK